MKKTLILLFGIIVFASCNTDKQYTQYVNPFIGTGGHGHTFPGATLPFGMVQLSPDNAKSGWDWCSGYHFSHDTLAGFSHTHLSGTGCPDLMDISFLPTVNDIIADTSHGGTNFMKKHYVSFSHKNESAKPGYYSVILDNGVSVELTATKRSGMQKYRFPEKSKKKIIIDLGFSLDGWDKTTASSVTLVNKQLLEGYRFSNGWAKNQKVFFATRLSHPVDSILFVNDRGEIISNVNEIKSENPITKDNFMDRGVKIVLIFDESKGDEIIIKTGISSVDTKGAINNVDAENPDFDFDAICKQASDTWNSYLSKIEVESKDINNLKKFYTALYHSAIHPSLYSDFDGRYRAHNDSIKTAVGHHMYYTFSLWDTYRTNNPLFTIIAPEVATDFVKSFIAHYRDFGLLPVWNLWGNETYCMIAYHSIPVITDAFKKGLLNDVDTEELWAAVEASAMGIDTTKDHKGLPYYIQYGYFPYDIQQEILKKNNWGEYGETGSRTIEWAYDDWCVAQLAKALNKNDKYDYYLKRSTSWKNIADTSTGFLRPRNADGSWLADFDPAVAHPSSGFTEGNAWQYSWYVPHDVAGLIDFMGGDNNFVSRLDSFFNPSSYDPAKNHFSDMSGLIGQYAHGNEPSHHIAYLYNYAGQPWKSQYRIRNILDSLYRAEPDGLAGNEDCGQMSAWFVMSALGMYPVNPAEGVYQIGTFLFDKATIHLNDSKLFIIKVDEPSAERFYVDKIMLNGKEIQDYKISHKEIMEGGEMHVMMKSKP